MSKTKRVRISNESLNSYGTRVLTSGMNVEQYNRNPVLLYMHERGQVIGYVKDLRVEGDEVTGELMFDEATELSQRCKKQWEFGSLKMVSAGIDILEMSEDPKHLVQGQTSPTITRSKLFEVSLVDIGANDDAIVLQKDGKLIELDKNGGAVLPLLNTIIINQTTKRTKKMDQEKIALELGLPKDADEAQISAELARLKAKGDEAESLRQERDTLRNARIETLVNAAISEKKIGEEKKQQFVELGKKIGADELKRTFDAMSVQVKLSNIVGGGASAGGHAEYKKLSEVPAEQLSELKEKNPAQYKKLYKAEYGFECEI